MFVSQQELWSRKFVQDMFPDNGQRTEYRWNETFK